MEHGWIFRMSKTMNWILGLLLLVCAPLIAAPPSDKDKAEIAPYLLPPDHPVKPTLDAIFSSSRVTFNPDTLKKAGFAKAGPREFSKVVFTTHAAIPGYVFKLYLDAQRNPGNLPDWRYWLMRVQGANRVREVIAAHGMEALFKVPRKWIYKLPSRPLPPVGYYPKYYILVEEDMELVSDKENEALWSSDFVTTQLLDGYYTILKEVGLSDCARIENAPFSRDGRVAFIDTQTFGRKKVPYHAMDEFLSKPNRDYWKAIRKN